MLKINLAEYVDASEAIGEDDEEGVCRRYLMQDSKINSTLKVSCHFIPIYFEAYRIQIGIYMKLLDAERSFSAYDLPFKCYLGFPDRF